MVVINDFVMTEFHIKISYLIDNEANQKPIIACTVKLVYNDQPWDRENVVVVWRWSLFKESNCQIN